MRGTTAKLQLNSTQIPNIILDEWMPTLTGASLCVVLVIARQTYGWHKEADTISYSQLIQKTGLSNGSVAIAVKYLKDKGYIEVVSDGIGKTSEYRINLTSPENGDDLSSNWSPENGDTKETTTKTSPNGEGGSFTENPHAAILNGKKIPEANIQAELFMQLKQKGFDCILEYKLGRSRFDCAVFLNDRLACIIEVKSYKDPLHLMNTETKQFAKYSSHGVPVLGLCRISDIPALVLQVEDILVDLSPLIIVKKTPSCPLLNGSPLKAQYPKGHLECVEYLQDEEAHRGFKFINPAKQYMAIHKILKAGYGFDKMEKTRLMVEKKYGAHQWDYSTMANWLEKGADRQ